MCSIVLSNTIRTFERRFILIDIRTRVQVSTCQKDFTNFAKKMENFLVNWENSDNLIFVPNFLFYFYMLNLFMNLRELFIYQFSPLPRQKYGQTS